MAAGTSYTITPADVRVVIARAPTRIDFGGGWTDVPPYTTDRGGCVCNIAITRHAAVNLTPSQGNVIIDDGGVIHEASHAGEFPATGGAELAKAALRKARIGPVRMEIRTSFPFGAGLGGSSAVGVATAAAIAAWREESVARTELAERSRAIEADEVGIAGGRQDHYAAALGGALGLWFSDTVSVRRIPLPAPLVAATERRCVVAYTGESRISGDTIRAVIDAYRLGNPIVVSALARMRALAEEMIAALERQSLDDLAALVGEHWQHQRSLHKGITTPQIENVLAAAREAGALGGKALGASGGGCVLVIAAEDRAVQVRNAVAKLAQVLPFTVDREGVSVSVQE